MPAPVLCALCHDEVDPRDRNAWKQVTVWVGGRKANGACMQSDDPLAWAHGQCISLARSRPGANHGRLAL